MADLAEYLLQHGVKVQPALDVDTLRRVELLRESGAWAPDVLVGINSCEGLTCPRYPWLRCRWQRFLRSTTSLIQTIDRAARNAGR